MSRTKRAQILMEPDDYARLEEIARRKRVSVAELIREAVRERYLADDRRRLIDEILAMELDLDLEDWEEVEREVEDGHTDDVP